MHNKAAASNLWLVGKHETFTSMQVWQDSCWAHISHLTLQLGSVISLGTHSENWQLQEQ